MCLINFFECIENARQNDKESEETQHEASGELKTEALQAAGQATNFQLADQQ